MDEWVTADRFDPDYVVEVDEDEKIEKADSHKSRKRKHDEKVPRTEML